MSLLFQPWRLRGAQFRNRIGVSPMCQYCAGEDGRPTDWHLAHLVSRAVGGAGMVMTEAAAVVPEGRISPHDLGIWDDAQLPGHARLAAAIAAVGAVPAMQLAHSGRKGSRLPAWDTGPAVPGWEALAPSADAFQGYAAPRAMSEEEIEDTIGATVAAGLRAAKAGYGLLELHAAHGYLLHQFLSPLANHRNDGWGGGFDGRTRIVRETMGRLRQALPEAVALGIRLSHTDWVEGGWSTEETVELARRLKGVADVVDVTSGGVDARQQIPIGPGYQLPGAEAVRKGAGIPVMGVGLITEPQQAEQALADGQCDMVLLARVLLREPNWPLRAAAELGAQDAFAIPPQYERGWGRFPLRRDTGAPMPAL